MPSRTPRWTRSKRPPDAFSLYTGEIEAMKSQNTKSRAVDAVSAVSHCGQRSYGDGVFQVVFRQLRQLDVSGYLAMVCD